MNALLVLYAGNLSSEANKPLLNGKNSIAIAIERSQKFPGVHKTVILAGASMESRQLTSEAAHFGDIKIETRPAWTVAALLDTLASLSSGFDFAYFAWADCPFLDPVLAEKMAERHIRYAAEYTYADGWPYGISPELLSPETAAILAKIAADLDENSINITREALFSLLQKDINAFDIETEISAVDLRCHRLNLCADSKRNFLLLQSFLTANGHYIPETSAIERIIEEKPEILRTLPAFYPVQVFEGCPHRCSFCPWAVHAKNAVQGRGFMEKGLFESLLDTIMAFSGDAVIDISLWGEIALHPQKIELIESVLRRNSLSLVIETSGVGWKHSELELCAEIAGKYTEKTGKFPAPLSWIVSLDTSDPERYQEIRGAGFAEAAACAKKLLSLFPKDTYVQAVRTEGAEEDIERFYRSWKETAGSAANVIIQKYDDFCGMLPRKQAADLSPVQRKPCWHLLRDMPVLLDGSVPLCRQQIAAADMAIILGNVFTDPLDKIWERGQEQYIKHTKSVYENSLCAGCDEYYTFNF